MTGLEQKKNTKRNVKQELNPEQLSEWRPNYDPSDDEIEKFADELMRWSKTSKAYKISQFYCHKRIDGDTFYIWVNRWPVLKKAHEIAMESIGNNREIGGLEGRLTPSIVMSTMGMYDKRFRSYYKWKQQISAKEHHKQQDIKVIIEAAPSSDVVPKMEMD